MCESRRSFERESRRRVFLFFVRKGYFYIEALLFFFSNSCVLLFLCYLLARGTKGDDVV